MDLVEAVSKKRRYIPCPNCGKNVTYRSAHYDISKLAWSCKKTTPTFNGE